MPTEERSYHVPTWGVAGKTVVVTGAPSGIGRETALKLARLGARVVIHGRRAERVNDAVEVVRYGAGKWDPMATNSAGAGLGRSGSKVAVHGEVADFSSLAQVRALAERLESMPAIDVLVNNAGTYAKRRILTRDGFELTFQVNYLAAFLLTLMLLPKLRESGRSRVINVSSIAHTAARLDFSNLQRTRWYDGYEAYATSKLALLMFTYDLAEREEAAGTGVSVNALHPGTVATNLLREAFPYSHGMDVDRGAQTSIYLAASPEVEGITGQYFFERRPVASSRLSRDQERRSQLWRLSEEMVGLTYPACFERRNP